MKLLFGVHSFFSTTMLRDTSTHHVGAPRLVRHWDLPRNSPMILLRASPSHTSGLYENSVWAREVSNNLPWRPSKWHLQKGQQDGEDASPPTLLLYINKEADTPIAFYNHWLTQRYVALVKSSKNCNLHHSCLNLTSYCLTSCFRGSCQIRW